MTRFASILAGGALCASLAGCAPDLSALANDKNAVCFTETSVWVSFTLERNGGCSHAIPALPAAPSPAAGTPAS